MANNLKQPTNNLQNLSYSQHDEEIDLRECFIIIAQGKWLIAILTAIVILFAATYVKLQPAIYQSKVSFIVSTGPYWNTDFQPGIEKYILPIISSESFRNQIKIDFEDDFKFPTVSVDRAGVYTATIERSTAKDAHTSLTRFVDELNDVYKEWLLSEVQVQSNVVESLAISKETENLTIIADNLKIAEALLSSEDFSVVQVLNAPNLPRSKANSNGKIVIVLAALFGLILSFTIIFVRHACQRSPTCNTRT
jgi:LPS O-antigen subunit length determinant protein (WzzB/FepE family)